MSVIRTYTFNINPVPKGRPKFSSRGGFYRAITPSKTRRFENEISLQATEINKKNKWDILDEPLSIYIDIALKRPKHIPKSRMYPCVRPDLDNFYKSITDALNNIVWKDDSIICKVEAEKFYCAEESSISIIVERLTWTQN